MGVRLLGYLVGLLLRWVLPLCSLCILGDRLATSITSSIVMLMGLDKICNKFFELVGPDNGQFNVHGKVS